MLHLQLLTKFVHHHLGTSIRGIGGFKCLMKDRDTFRRLHGRAVQTAELCQTGDDGLHIGNELFAFQCVHAVFLPFFAHEACSCNRCSSIPQGMLPTYTRVANQYSQLQEASIADNVPQAPPLMPTSCYAVRADSPSRKPRFFPPLLQTR